MPDQPQPEDLLRDAADELGRLSNGEVTAELRTHVDHQTITVSFYLVSEKVGYRHLLFRASHGLGFPVTIHDHPGSRDELPNDFSFCPPAVITCEDSSELETELRQIFEHPDTQKIVGQLRHLSRAAS
jgi:hypothetical protein